MKPFLLLSLLTYISAGSLSCLAQKFTVRTLALNEVQMPDVFLKLKDKYQPLEWSSYQASTTTETEAMNPLPIYKKGTGENGEEAFVISQRVKIPSDTSQVLLLGWKSGGKTDGKVSYLAIDDNFKGASSRDWILMNAGSKPVAFRVGEKSKPIVVAPGESQKYKIANTLGDGAAVTALSSFGGKKKVFYSTYWPVRSGSRSIIVFFDQGEKVGVKRISDKLGSAE